MVETDIAGVDERITLRRDSVETDVDCLPPHLRLDLLQVMSQVRPEDLSAAEIAALLAILGPALTRVIGGPASRPRLHVLGGRREHPAPDLA